MFVLQLSGIQELYTKYVDGKSYYNSKFVNNFKHVLGTSTE